jgi:hypothetical protein
MKQKSMKVLIEEYSQTFKELPPFPFGMDPEMYRVPIETALATKKPVNVWPEPPIIEGVMY